MAINITRGGSRAFIGNAAVNVNALKWNPKSDVIRFEAQGVQPIVIQYNDLLISGATVANRDDAVSKLNNLFPDVAGNLTEEPLANGSATTTRYFGSHCVLSLLHQDAPGGAGLTIQDWLQAQKDAGYNLIWAHCDDYDPTASYYKTNLLALIDAAEAIGGIWISPGLFNHTDTGANTATIKNKNMITDTWERKGVLRIDGKQAYLFYNYRADSPSTATFNQMDLDDLLLTQEGIHPSDWLLIADTQYPYSFDNRATWQGETTGARGIKRWSITFFKGVKPGVSPYFTVTDMDKVLTDWTAVTGTAVFGVDMALDVMIDNNNHKSRIAKRKKLQGGAWVGISGFYASASFWDFGYTGLGLLMSAVTSMRVEDRPIGVLATTSNDDVEYSRMSPMIGMSAGLRYIPSAGTYVGTSLPTPVLDRRGMTDFIRPWVNAFVNNKQDVTFLSNRIFCWYMLHPKTAPFIATIPSAMTAIGFTQANWNTMGYAVGTNAIRGITAITGVDNIQMAAHIIQPSYLKINNTLSGLQTPPATGGPAYFEIPLSSFTGSPVFSIIASDATTVIKTGTGPQPITNSCWPGGWGLMATEV